MSVAGQLRVCLLGRLFIGVVMQSNPHPARRKVPSDRTADAA